MLLKGTFRILLLYDVADSINLDYLNSNLQTRPRERPPAFIAWRQRKSVSRTTGGWWMRNSVRRVDSISSWLTSLSTRGPSSWSCPLSLS